MHIFTNLPGTLRFLFGIMRLLTLLLGAFWLFAFLFGPWLSQQFSVEPRLMVSVGEVSVRVDPAAVTLKSDTAKTGSLGLNSLRGNLQLDLCSRDAGLVSALRWTVGPTMIVLTVFSWMLFGALHRVCANVERGEVLTESNLRLVRRVGVLLIVYSVASGGAGLWAAQVMGGYLNQHVTLSGLTATPGALGFLMPAGLVTVQGGLVIGGLVLVVSEAFRQGLSLKTESELTI